MNFKLFIGILLLSSIFISACNSGSNSGGSSGGNYAPAQQKCERVQVPYTDYEQLKYNIVGEPIISSKTTGLNYYKRVSLKIQNSDTETGQFAVDFYFKTLKRGSATINRNSVIEPTQTVEFTADYDVDLGEDVEVNYDIKPGQKTVTKYREETRCN